MVVFRVATVSRSPCRSGLSLLRPLRQKGGNANLSHHLTKLPRFVFHCVPSCRRLACGGVSGVCFARVFDRAVGCVVIVWSCPSPSWCFGRWGAGRCAFGRLLTPESPLPTFGGASSAEEYRGAHDLRWMSPPFRYFLTAQCHGAPRPRSSGYLTAIMRSL